LYEHLWEQSRPDAVTADLAPQRDVEVSQVAHGLGASQTVAIKQLDISQRPYKPSAISRAVVGRMRRQSVDNRRLPVD